MKLICIDNSQIKDLGTEKPNLTYGKEYTPLNTQMAWNIGIKIENDIMKHVIIF
jgi:hypothetical protein